MAAPSLQHQARDPLLAAIEAVDGGATGELQRVLTALVAHHEIAGAAFAQATVGIVCRTAGWAVPDAHRHPTVAAARRSGQLTGPAADHPHLLAAPVPAESHDLVLIAAPAVPEVALPASGLVATCAHLLGTRLELVEARRRLRIAEERTETLLSATLALGRTLELQDVFTAILGELRQVVPYDSASVQQLEGTRLRIIGGHGFPNLEEILGLSFDLTKDDNPNRGVIATRRSLILEDASERYPAFRERVHIPAGIRGWMGVPLLFGDRVLGMLSVDSRQPGFYTDDHVRVTEAFAAQAAVAIENARLFEEMRHLARHDELTGLPNRRQLEEVAAERIATAVATGRPLSLLTVDLDRFKVINDTYGHPVGDEVLREVARRATELVRPDDLLARLGGEEFVVLLPDTPTVAATAVGERLRASSRRAIPTSAGPVKVTMSIGVVTLAAGEETLGALMRRADHALYAAKSRGRDCVVAA